MLHGLLLVLKIAGIILAVLLGIVLAAAAAVLFVPVRYTADAQYDKTAAKSRCFMYGLHGFCICSVFLWNITKALKCGRRFFSFHCMIRKDR